MGKAENEITQSIKRELQQHGIFCWKNWGGPFSKPGVPDLLGIAQGGQFVGVEVKTDRGRLGEQQKAFLERIKDHGGIGFVAHSAADAREQLKNHGIERKQLTIF